LGKTAVLFDLGNVLVRLDMARGLARLRSLSGRGPASLEEAAVFFGAPALACNRGELGPDAFIDALAAAVGATGLARATLRDVWCDIFTPWPEMEALAERVLAAAHPAYLLSNTDPIHFEWLARRMPVLGRLDGLHLSYEVGRLKPDPAFFTSALERFGLEAARCAFLDDRPENVEAARSVGIPAQVHRGDLDEVRAFLASRGVTL
jgi:FMN phosphatase YigB (HAD superfamily)